MKKLFVGLMLMAVAPNAFAAYRNTGGEYHDKPYRAPQPIQQIPVSVPVMGSCGANLPLSQSYQARPAGVSCGQAAAPTKKREQLTLSEEIMERWDILSRSGRADAQQEMQKIRQQEMKWSGQVSIPMQEHWTFTEIVGDYADRCGYEQYNTTCFQDREESYTYTWTTRECTGGWETIDDSPSPSFGGGSSGGYSSGGSSYSSGSPSRSSGGSRESGSSHRNDARGSWGPGASLELDLNRGPSSLRCRSYSDVPHSETRWRSASRLSYACVKTRPKWCTWPTTSAASRACKSHVAKYSVNYEKSPQWAPGYQDANAGDVRNYIDILPNRWDLLIGESEKIDLSFSGSKSIVPDMNFKNGLADHDQPWNGYSFRSEPQAVTCAFNMEPEFKIGVITHGRILQAAPNPLRLPKEPLKFALEKNNRPESLELNDNGRGTRLKAAQNSRNLEHNQKVEGLKGASASGGYWEETRFKIQLFRKDAKGREVRVTVQPESYSYDQVDVFDDTITISLEGRDGTDRFYRPGGPLEFIFGRMYKAFNIELTPGTGYFVRVRVVSRGLPFYDSGCTGGKAICKGEDGSNDAYSEPIDIPFTADSATDKRSWFKKFRDWQERRLWL